MKRIGLALVLSVAACARVRAESPPRSASDLVCPAGTKRDFSSVSDNGWGYPEQTEGCSRPDGKLEGWAFELLGSAPKLKSTQRVGRYANGKRVGLWTQVDAQTGAVLGRFTLDASGSGTEVIRDQAGHTLAGPVVNGERQGTWTYSDRDGSIVATEVWSHDRAERRVGKVSWDPPMMAPEDACPTTRAKGEPEDDGCPAPAGPPK
jgi:hypothetical protein